MPAKGLGSPSDYHPRLREYGVGAYSDEHGAPVYFPNAFFGPGYIVNDVALKGRLVSRKNQWFVATVLASCGAFFGWLMVRHHVSMLPPLMVLLIGVVAQEAIIGGRIRKSMRASPMRLSMADVYFGEAQDFVLSGKDVWSARYSILVFAVCSAVLALFGVHAIAFLLFFASHTSRWIKTEFLAWVARRMERGEYALPCSPAWVLSLQGLVFVSALLGVIYIFH